MDLVFAYDTYNLTLLHIISIFILVSVNIAIWLKAKKILLLYAYLSVQLILLLWMVSKILKTVAPDAQTKFVFVVLQYIGVCFLGIMFFCFAFLYAKGHLPNRRTIILLSVIPTFSIITLITNPLHALFYAHFDFWGDSFGPVFYIHQAYNYILIGAGIFLCAKYFLRHFGAKRIQAVLFSAAIIIPLAVNIIYVFGWVDDIFGFSPPCDLTPISCNLSLLMFALAVFRFKFFDDVKIARGTALDTYPDGVLILDENDRIASFNETFRRMYSGDMLSLKTASCFIEQGPAKLELARHSKAVLQSHLISSCDETYETDKGDFYRVICRPVYRKNKACGRSLQFTDVTFKQVLLEKTAQKNLELSQLNERLQEQALLFRELMVARTRNLIAHEVHDVLGHSVVVVISLLEAARLSFEKADFDLHGVIAKATAALVACTKKSPLQGLDRGTGKKDLVEQLKMMAEEISSASVEVALTVTGQLPPMSEACAEAIYKLCREGITNAIRHGGARQIDIILRNCFDGIEVYLIDDGRGCQEVKKGMGIAGMEARLCLLGGILRFGPMDGGGFLLHTIIPVK